MNDLTEEDRKRLTEYLDECWHEIIYPSGSSWQCKKCYAWYLPPDAFIYRTFTTPDGFFTLKDKLVENGEWAEFTKCAGEIWERLNSYVDLDIPEFTDWLINAPRFCGLVNEWLKEKEDKP